MKKGTRNQALGDYIQARRTSRNMDIRQVADDSGFHESYWRKLEAGHYTSPDVTNLRIIAKTLSCPLEDLYSLCGYTLPTELPSFAPYLRATTRLSAEDIAVMDRIYQSMTDPANDADADRSAA